MTPTPAILLVLAIVSWRTWYLLAHDRILNRIRDEVAPTGSKLREFLECPYCAGFWVAGMWVTLWDDTRKVLPGIVEWQAGWWACAAGVVIIDVVVDRLSGE